MRKNLLLEKAVRLLLSTFAFLLFISSLFIKGQGTETFENIPTSSSTNYSTRTWNGVNATSWSATDARTDVTITTKAITIRSGSLTFGLTAAQKAAGIGSLTLKAKAPYGNPDVGTLQLVVNGTVISAKTTTGATISTVVSYTWSDINVSTLTSIVINQTTQNSRIAIDDISWTAAPASGSAAPTLNAAASATVDAPFDVTFTDDATWRGAITGVTVGGTALTAGYSVSSGKITFTPSASVPANLLQSSGTKSIVVNATGYSGATVSQTIGVGAPTKLAIKTQPTAPATNGAALAAQPAIYIQDQYGNTTTSTATVTATPVQDTWTLGGTTGVAGVNGTTTFSGLTASSLGPVTGATITFTSGSLTSVTSTTFNLPAPPPPTLTAASGATVDGSFTITFADNATWRAAITSITVGGTTLAAGAYSITSGQITFTPSASTLLQSSGTKTIAVIATGYTNASVSQAIGVGAPAKLAIKTQPTAPASNGAVLVAQPAIYIQDQYGNTTTSTATVTATPEQDTWTLGGTTGVAAVNGTTTFSGLTATSAAAVTGATITFTSGTLTAVTSNAFNIPTPPPANDNCAGAIALTLNAAPITGDVTSATQSLAAFCTGTAEDDVWYSFTTANAGDYTIKVAGSASFDAVVELLSGTCNGTNVACANTSGSGGTETLVTNLSANTTYYVRVYDYGSGVPATTSFTIGIVQPPVATAATNIGSSSFTANWNAVAGATGYYLDVSTSSTFSVPPTVTLGSEAFENTLTLFTGSGGTYYSANSASADRPASYPFAFAGSYGFGISNGTATITSNNINTATYVSPQLSFKLASFSIGSSGNGADASDTVTVEVSPDGGATYYNTVRISGNSNAYWAYNATGIASAAYDADNTPVDFSPAEGGSRTSDGYSTVTVTGLPSTPNLKIRISLLNNSTAERWVIDDLKVTGLAGSFVMGYNGLAVSGTSQAVTGLTPNTTYYYRVRAVNGSSSLNSNVIQVTTRSGATTWNGTAWSDGAPLKDIDAIIDGDYSGASFESQTLTVNTGKTLTVNSFVKTGNVTNNGNIIVANNANFVQAGTFVSVDGASFKVRKDTKAVKRLAYMNWSSPMANSSQTLKQFSYGKKEDGSNQSTTGTVDNRFYTYNNGIYVATAATGTFAKGQGYLIRTPNDFTTSEQTFHGQFEGTVPNSGEISYDHSGLTGSFILLGNPYPSAISYDDFITKNSNTNQTIYMWNSQVEMTNNQYTGTLYNSYNKAGANPANSFDGYIPVGQGFFVERTNNTPFVFTDSMRRTSESGMMSKSANVSKDRFWLEMTSPSGAKPQLLIGFFPTATSGIDQGFDATVLDASTNVLYTTVEDKKLNIDAHGSFDEGDEFSLSANLTENGTYSIGILQKEGIFNAGQKVYLKDQLTGSITDLTTGQYEFTDTIGLKNNRFSIVFKPSGVLDTQSVTKEEVKIVSVGKEVRVKAEQNIVAVEIYDLSGKKLAVAKPNQRQASLTLLAQGIVIVKVTLQNNVEKSKKVILK